MATILDHSHLDTRKLAVQQSNIHLLSLFLHRQAGLGHFVSSYKLHSLLPKTSLDSYTTDPRLTSTYSSTRLHCTNSSCVMHLSPINSISTFSLLLPSVLAIAHPTITPGPALPTSLAPRSPSPSPDKVSIKPFTLASIHLDLPSNTCHPTIAPDKNGFVPPTECNALYRFYPSFAAAVVFSLLFGVVTVVHFAQAAAYRKVGLFVFVDERLRGGGEMRIERSKKGSEC